MVRRVLFATLAVAPIAVALHYLADIPQTVEFVISALALIPLAWLIGEATEHAAEHTGPGIGGFLNATFGNAPELIIALIAVHEGLTEVVRGSLTGSVVSNLLLVLGAALAAGGRGQLDRFSSFISLGLLAFATVMFLIPAIPSWEGRSRPRIARGTVGAGLDRASDRLCRHDLVLASTAQRDPRRERRGDQGGGRSEPL